MQACFQARQKTQAEYKEQAVATYRNEAKRQNKRRNIRQNDCMHRQQLEKKNYYKIPN